MRGDGRVFPRGGVWHIAYYVRGKEIREPGGATEKIAAKKLRQRLLERDGNRFIGPKEERLTVDALLDSLITHLETRGAKAVRTLRCHLKPIRGAFGHVRAIEISTAAVERFIEERLAAKKSRATVNREVASMKQAFHLARKQERVSRVPYFPMLREDNARQGFFERDEFERLTAALPDTLADVARFGYASGWRKSEILPLTWEAIDRSAREVRLSTSKNGRGRVLPLDGSLWEIIERRWKAREFTGASGVSSVSPLVFHLHGKQFGDFRKTWAAACKTAKIPGKLFHDLRRTAVRNLIRAGVPETVAMSITGHRTRAVFDRYNITSESDKRAAIIRADAHLASVESNVSAFPLNAEHGQKADKTGSSH